MFNQFSYVQLSGRAGDVDDVDVEACIAGLANIFHRAISFKESS